MLIEGERLFQWNYNVTAEEFIENSNIFFNNSKRLYQRKKTKEII